MKRILIVEDEPDLQENICSLLMEKGFDVITAENGLDALKKLETEIPDLIISDIMMPYIDGYELFRRVKIASKTKMIPFLFLTAKTDLSSIRKGMNLGADDYITKPFSSEDLLHSIQIRLDKSDLINQQIDEIRQSISKYIPHELRNPLVAILGYSQIITSEIDNLDKNDILEMIERISVSGKRLHNRIEKFIQFSDLEHFGNNNSDEKQISCINENFINEFLNKYFEVNDRKRDITLTIEPSQVEISELYLTTILKELLENAVKFSEPDSSININGKQENRFYILEVQDSGIGMEEFQINRIGAFRQFNRNEMQQEGNGLGLEIVKRILEKHNGTLIIKSKKNTYTKVTIKLPAV